ncbi:hypothetical protein DC487_08520 [Sphingobacterium corticibacter]|uniref:Uncharacterized protein n=2 Tax=Sphingobacterium corticibacter TaxID=2171749 RepID=A0A2T8HKI1_9SPHI|nr:hypothetical protein DC487_08520 [Sphingobacterium corticibacter]
MILLALKNLLFMRLLLIGFAFLLCSGQSFSQTNRVHTTIVSVAETKSLLNDSICQSLGITYPIFRVYRYTDVTGTNYSVMTESNDLITADGDTVSTKIKVLHLLEERGQLRRLWEVNDQIKEEETFIRIWTKFVDFGDHDNDGIIEPILVYGTSALNGYDDGRIKILICGKAQKIGIRHQNGVLDDERMTTVDATFYHLPISIQDAVREKIVLLEENDLAIFPYGWQDAMKQKKLKWKE